MKDELLTALVQLAMARLDLAQQIKKLAIAGGATDESWEDKAHELAMQG
jgi:hypothetical protein